MNCILKPNIKFHIRSASTSLAKHGPLRNIDILKQFPRMAKKSDSFLLKFSERIEKEFGFVTRYWAHLPWRSLNESREETSEKLSYEAVHNVVTTESSRQVQAFILGSTTTNRYTGSQACSVLGKLNMHAAAFDVKAGCSTSLACLQHAYALMALGYEYIVVSCAETLSKVIDPQNELTYFGLADGGAALYLQKSESGAFTVESVFFSSKGEYVDAFTTQGLLPPSQEELDERGYQLQGDESLLKKLAYEQYSQMLSEILSEFDKSEIKWIIPHQVSAQLIQTLIQEHGLSHSSLIWHADKIGNIGGASIAYSLAQAWQDGVFNQRGKILMMSVGGGLTYACHIIDFKLGNS